jgi:hypothetical protein
LIQFLKKIIASNQRNWHKKLIDVIWVSQITPMGSTRESPYTMVYINEAYRMPIHLELNSLAMARRIKYMEEDSPLQDQYNQLMQLEEHKAQSFTTMNERQ